MYFPTDDEQHREAVSDHSPPPQFETPGPYMFDPGLINTWPLKR
jgi:hypothetical protein